MTGIREAVDEAIDAAMDEATVLSFASFDPVFLNDDQVVAVPGSSIARRLRGWSDVKSAWEVSATDDESASEFHPVVACVYDTKYFTDFLLGDRGRICTKSGDSCPADEAARFERFEAAGGVQGSKAPMLQDTALR